MAAACLRPSLARHGSGIGTMMDEVPEACPEVMRVLDEVPSVQFPIWRVPHRGLGTTQRIRIRIRIVFDLLAEAFVAPTSLPERQA